MNKLKINDIALKGAIHAQLAVQDFVSKHPREMIIANRMVAFTALMLVADQAMAATLGEWSTNFKENTLKPLLDFCMYGAYVGGMGCTGRGVKHLVDYSRNAPGSTFNEALGWTFGGGALMGLGAISSGVGDSMSTGGCPPGAYCGV